MKVLSSLLLLFLCCFSSIIKAQESSISWKQALNQEKGWYADKEAQRIADNVLFFQRNIGGWEKNRDMAKVLKEDEKQKLEKLKTSDEGTTIDNNATFTQMRYLARVYNATGNHTYKEGFLKGLDYLLEAQYNNGGWPQYYPIREGYYEHITYNDGAMIGVMRLLRDISEERETFDFVDDERIKSIDRALKKGLDIILKTQVEVDGKLTVWCAQHDKDTLKPAKARAYELPSLSGSESVGIVRYLMELENPDENIINAVEGAINWFEESKITGKNVKWVKDESYPDKQDRVVENDKDADPLWGRFYDIETNKPIYVGRDGKIKYKLSEIEQERRVNYSYVGDYASELLEKEYPEWKKKIGKKTN